MPGDGAPQQPAPAPPPPLLLLLLLLLAPAARAACRISELACRGSGGGGSAPSQLRGGTATPRCVPLDSYCNGRPDCPDGSDEPRGCSICNRTLYGDVGHTYEISLQRPRDVRPPFFCHLTFTASGQGFGDLVQLTFDEMSIGRLIPARGEAGCPDGHLQLAELGRPQPGGPWCGAGGGSDAVFYSEASTVTLSLRFFGDPPPPTKPPPFRFRLRYKFVSRSDAVVRFGDEQLPLERGEPVPGTYCSRNFFECYRQRCRLQSPNFPGLFPRNVTCILSLRQKDVPRCKHAMIGVSPAPQTGTAVRKTSIVDTGRPTTVGPPTSTNVAPVTPATATDLCSEDSDHLVFYDGSSPTDPVLARWCANNDDGATFIPPPKVLSRGPDLLVAFHSSPYATPLRATPAFQLDVDVMFADSDSLDFQREARRCEFEVNSTATLAGQPIPRSGQIISPRHTLPPNTTCKYHLRGAPSDRVWLFFLAYSVTPAPTGYCATRLRVWDGGGVSGLLLLGAHCGAGGPRLCAHAALRNATSAPRPCGPHESYESTGTDLTVHLSTSAGTALQPAYFRLRYEFVDTELGGDPLGGRLAWTSLSALSAGAAAPSAPATVAAASAATSQPLPGSLANPYASSRPPIACARLFRNRRSGDVHSPRNVFMFGRGGAVNLTCVYRIEASAGEHIRLTVQNASLGGNCITLADAHTGRPTCVYRSGARAAELRIWEAPWKDVRLPRACVCGNSISSFLPFVFTSAARTVELTLTISEMTPGEDASTLFFHSSYVTLLSEGASIRGPEDCAELRRISGSGGEISFVSPINSDEDKRCGDLPWLVEAQKNHSLFLMTWGTPLPPVAATLHRGSTGATTTAIVHTIAGSTATEEAPEETKCHTRSRLMLYSGKPLRLSKVFCPLPPTNRQYMVQVFSEEWLGTPGPPVSHTPPWGRPPPTSQPAFLVEFVARDEAVATLHWLEISRPRSALQQKWPSSEDGAPPPTNATAPDPGCPFRCPELDACIHASLWCDGRVHCPSGADERGPACGSLSRRLLALLPDGLVIAAAGGAAAGAALCVLLTALALLRARRRRRRRRRRSKSLLLLAKADSTTLSSLASVDGVNHVNATGNYHHNATGVDYNPYGHVDVS